MREEVLGPVLVVAILGGAMAWSMIGVWTRPRTTTLAITVGLLGAWGFSALYPALRVALPRRPLTGVLLRHVDEGLPYAVRVDESGPLEIVVHGSLEQSNAATASYTLSIADSTANIDEVRGTLERSAQVRAQVHRVHFLATARGPVLTIRALRIDPVLDELVIDIHASRLDPRIPLLVGAACFLIALAIDVGLGGVTYLAVGAGFTLVFAYSYPQEATPHSLVQPAIETALLALAVGGGGGGLARIAGLALKQTLRRTR